MPNFNEAELQALDDGNPLFGLFLRLECDPVVRMWLGIANIKPGVNALDATGAVYRGFGELVDMPAFQQLADGTAERIEFAINGIPNAVFGDIAPVISEQQEAIAGAPLSAGYAMFDDRWRMLGSVHWSWDGVADYLKVEKAVVSGDEPETWAMKLSAGGWLTGKRRPGRSYFVHSDQASRAFELNPSLVTDRFCERTTRYQDYEKRWPNFPT